MKSSHGQSTTTTLLVALLALTFGCHAVSTLAQAKGRYCGEKTASIISKIDVPAVTAFQNAWRIAGNGRDRFEALVLLYWKADGSILARSEGRNGEHNSFTFGWTSNIIAVAHTHPNSEDPRPSGLDMQVADKFGVPVFTLTKRGMYVYDPDTRRTSMVKKSGLFFILEVANVGSQVAVRYFVVSRKDWNWFSRAAMHSLNLPRAQRSDKPV